MKSIIAGLLIGLGGIMYLTIGNRIDCYGLVIYSNEEKVVIGPVSIETSWDK